MIEDAKEIIYETDENGNFLYDDEGDPSEKNHGIHNNIPIYAITEQQE